MRSRGHGLETGADLGKALQHEVEILEPDAHRLHVVQRGAGGGANPAAEQREFTEKTAPPDVRQDQVSTGMGLGDFDEADSHQEETVGRLSLAANHLPGRITSQFHAISQISNKFRRDRREHRNAAEVGFQCALAVALFHPGAERFIPPHDVQHVPQHFERGTVGLGPHCGRARIIVHAGHFAEQVASLELAYRIVVGQVDRRINRNEIRFAILPRPLLAAERKHGLQLAKEVFLSPGLYLGHGRRNIDLSVPIKNVEGGRAIVAFLANDLARFVAALSDRVAVQVQERAGDPAKHFDLL